MGLFDYIRKSDRIPAEKKKINELIDDLRQGKTRAMRTAAEEALATRGNESVYSLIGALNDSDWRVRESSVKILGKIKDERSIVPLIQRFKDEQVRIQLWATDALISMNERSVGPLITALTDRDRRVRMGAIVALGEIQDIRAVNPLENIAADPRQDDDVRETARDAIENIKGTTTLNKDFLPLYRRPQKK
jgi:HEAT repeat protein